MIDPVIFTLPIGDFELVFRWYGLLIMLGVVVAAWVSDRELARRGGNTDWIWDPVILVVPAAIVGARGWYVLNSIMGGSKYYLDDPSRIFRITEGGLHIFGGLIVGGLVAYLYARIKHVDFLLMLDSIAPAMLIGQAIARPANFINQELYGQPTTLPWGIPIDAAHRIGKWVDMTAYPETIRFHPTFAYEMIWNLIAAGIILFVVRRYATKIKPGAAFAMWLIAAGLGRFIVEFWRPDQPLIPGTLISYSRLFSLLMFLAGVIWLLIRYEKLKVKFLPPGPEEYRLTTKKYSLRKAARNKARMNK